MKEKIDHTHDPKKKQRYEKDLEELEAIEHGEIKGKISTLSKYSK